MKEKCANCEEEFAPGELFFLEDRFMGGAFFACEQSVRDLGREAEVGISDDAKGGGSDG